MEIHLDNSATTPVLPEVKEAMSQMFDMEYGNPSSMHLKGVMAEERVLEAGLAGYAEYRKRVRYKVIPYVW